jgi:uncharacterized SAM-dependent methyltransferase
VPFDVSEAVLRASAEQLVEDDPRRALARRHLGALPPAEGSRIVVFLGGTLPHVGLIRRTRRPSRRAATVTDAV